MNVLDLAQEMDLDPKRVSYTRGGEYKSSCPNCKEGKDRFCIWPNEGLAGKYWCRICGCHGDAIQFCRDFFGLSYLDSCKKVNVEPRQKSKFIKGHCPFKTIEFKPKLLGPLDASWQKAAKTFIHKSHNELLNNPEAHELLFQRGFNRITIGTFLLGWNPKTLFDARASWGLPNQLNADGKDRKQWLPAGIVIPTFENELPVRIKIRRNEWHPEDKLPKYTEIAGGLQRPSLYGDPSKPIVVMESELDSILLQQFASDICCSLALGGVGKRPDKQMHELLARAPLILLALDYDEAGKKEYPFWMQLYPNLRPWPARKGKSPGDSYKLHQVDLRKWIADGLSHL